MNALHHLSDNLTNLLCIAAGFIACAIIVIIMAARAPRGREIPGVGFVTDEMSEPFGDVVHGGRS
jgi:hypothetical protein